MFLSWFRCCGRRGAVVRLRERLRARQLAYSFSSVLPPLGARKVEQQQLGWRRGHGQWGGPVRLPHRRAGPFK